jgi:thiosulfate/3-mercaptopyruvate sulfurtransferase
VNGAEEVLLLDARPQSFWEGEQSHKASSRIPQPRGRARSPSRSISSVTAGSPTGAAIVSAEDARRLAEARGFTGAEALVSFCNIGHWTATNCDSAAVSH